MSDHDLDKTIAECAAALDPCRLLRAELAQVKRGRNALREALDRIGDETHNIAITESQILQNIRSIAREALQAKP